jgi:23S rRNA (uridine2552-2'-O)-methyltransferase
VKKSSSSRWLKEHFSDVYVKRAKQEGFRSRSVYKLMEINQRYKIIKPSMLVVDLGAAPGGWSEYVVQIIGQKGKIFALDILPMRPIRGVEFILGDFTQGEVVASLRNHLGDQKIDVVLSDMAPNMSGVKVADQMRSMDLAEKALNFSLMVLKSGGTFVIKMFHGAGFEDFLKDLGRNFAEVKVVKPEASRTRSSEVFLLARNFKPKSDS